MANPCSTATQKSVFGLLITPVKIPPHPIGHVPLTADPRLLASRAEQETTVSKKPGSLRDKAVTINGIGVGGGCLRAFNQQLSLIPNYTRDMAKKVMRLALSTLSLGLTVARHEKSAQIGPMGIAADAQPPKGRCIPLRYVLWMPLRATAAVANLLLHRFGAAFNIRPQADQPPLPMSVSCLAIAPSSEIQSESPPQKAADFNKQGFVARLDDWEEPLAEESTDDTADVDEAAVAGFDEGEAEFGDAEEEMPLPESGPADVNVPRAPDMLAELMAFFDCGKRAQVRNSLAKAFRGLESPLQRTKLLKALLWLLKEQNTDGFLYILQTLRIMPPRQRSAAVAFMSTLFRNASDDDRQKVLAALVAVAAGQRFALIESILPLLKDAPEADMRIRLIVAMAKVPESGRGKVVEILVSMPPAQRLKALIMATDIAASPTPKYIDIILAMSSMACLEDRVNVVKLVEAQQTGMGEKKLVINESHGSFLMLIALLTKEPLGWLVQILRHLPEEKVQLFAHFIAELLKEVSPENAYAPLIKVVHNMLTESDVGVTAKFIELMLLLPPQQRESNIENIMIIFNGICRELHDKSLVDKLAAIDEMIQALLHTADEKKIFILKFYVECWQPRSNQPGSYFINVLEEMISNHDEDDGDHGLDRPSLGLFDSYVSVPHLLHR